MKGEDGEHDKEHGSEKPWVNSDRFDILRLCQQNSPAGRRCSQSETEKTECGFAENHRRNSECQTCDNMVHQEREQMMKKDSKPAGSLRDGGCHEGFLTKRENFSSDFAGKAGPADQRENDRDSKKDFEGGPVCRKSCGQSHPERDRRNRLQNFDQALDSEIDPRSEERR